MFDQQQYEYRLAPGKKSRLEQLADIATILVALLTVYQVISGNRSLSLEVVAGFFIILLVLSWTHRFRGLKELRQAAREKRTVLKYRSDLINLIERGQGFVRMQSDNAIPYFIRTSLKWNNNTFAELNQHLDNLFADCLFSISLRVKKQSKSFTGFVGIMREFSHVMAAFISIYVDYIIRELKKPENVLRLPVHSKANLQLRYIALKLFIAEWDSFVENFSNAADRHDTLWKLQKPSEILE